ncbi:MAG: hypothetical protein NTW03_15655 [Verrucomicrobia bacterium]|nr:hypothetical protein [Verrucomicrobiota bacterium]
MRYHLFLLPVACLLLSGCGQEAKPAKAGDNPLNAPADYVGALGKAQKSAAKTLATASLDQAIKVFFAQENRYPRMLSELVSNGALPSLPDPPKGMQFDYDAASGMVKVVPKK